MDMRDAAGTRAATPRARPARRMAQIIFCGFLIQKDDVQPYFIEFWYMSFFRYGFTPLVANEFRYGSFDDCRAAGAECPLGVGRVARSTVVTDVLGFDLDAIPRYDYIQLMYFGATLVVTYYAMRYQARKQYG